MNETTTVGVATEEDQQQQLKDLERSTAESRNELNRLEARREMVTGAHAGIQRELSAVDGPEWEAKLKTLALADSEITIDLPPVESLQRKQRALRIVEAELHRRIVELRRDLGIYAGGIVRLKASLDGDSFVQEAVDAIGEGSLQDKGPSITAFFRGKGIDRGRAEKLSNQVYRRLARQRLVS